jgi:hypothetical protein
LQHRRPRDAHELQAIQPHAPIEPHDAHPTRIDNRTESIDRDRRLRDVRGQNHPRAPARTQRAILRRAVQVAMQRHDLHIAQLNVLKRTLDPRNLALARQKHKHVATDHIARTLLVNPSPRAAHPTHNVIF